MVPRIIAGICCLALGGSFAHAARAEHVVLLHEVWTYAMPRERAVIAHHLEHEGWLSNTDKSQIRRVRRRLRAALGEGA